MRTIVEFRVRLTAPMQYLAYAHCAICDSSFQSADWSKDQVWAKKDALESVVEHLKTVHSGGADAEMAKTEVEFLVRWLERYTDGH